MEQLPAQLQISEARDEPSYIQFSFEKCYWPFQRDETIVGEWQFLFFRYVIPRNRLALLSQRQRDYETAQLIKKKRDERIEKRNNAAVVPDTIFLPTEIESNAAIEPEPKKVHHGF